MMNNFDILFLEDNECMYFISKLPYFRDTTQQLRSKQAFFYLKKINAKNMNKRLHSNTICEQ